MAARNIVNRFGMTSTVAFPVDNFNVEVGVNGTFRNLFDKSQRQVRELSISVAKMQVKNNNSHIGAPSDTLLLSPVVLTINRK